jgi:hypothetical protein
MGKTMRQHCAMLMQIMYWHKSKLPFKTALLSSNKIPSISHEPS